MKGKLLGLIIVALLGYESVTLAGEPKVQRIGIAGCHRQDGPAPALWRYVSAKPDLMLWIGDNVYADTEDNIDHLKQCHATLAALPAFVELRESSMTAASWDDHDYGLNNFGKDYPLKEESRQFFRKFWKLEEHIPADRNGIYHARYFGEGEHSLQIIHLDGRYNRDDEGETGDTLGEAQWAWLKKELQKPARLRFLVSGYQYFLPQDSVFESWSKFPQSRDRLINLIKSTGAQGVVFIAGDQHYSEITRVPGLLGYDAVEIMFCGVNQEEPHVPNPLRVSPVAHAKNAYSLIDIQWNATENDEPHLTFRAFDADRDAVEMTYRINLAELQP